MSYTLIEPCCGSSAFTLHMLGARKSLMPYQGSKWRFRKDLECILCNLGYIGYPGKIILSDPGPWGIVIKVILSGELRNLLIKKLKELDKKDPHLLFLELHQAKVSDNLIDFAAEFLFLQRLSFSGKAVGIRNDMWNSPGFNKTSAYGISATERFGTIKPMISSLITTLCSYEKSVIEVECEIYNTSAILPDGVVENTVVYIDPPYINATAYPNGNMTRDDTINLAKRWYDCGASVIISEQSMLQELEGWNYKIISNSKSDKSPFRGKKEEWVTYKGIK